MRDARAARAAARRASSLPGRIVRPGERKGELYDELLPEARLEAYWQLIQRAWKASGRELPSPGPRRELWGEIFRIADHG